MSDITPIVDDQEMLRAYAETIRLKEAEIDQLKRDNAFMASLYNLTSEIERLRAEAEMMSTQAFQFRDLAQSHAALLIRAADTLDGSSLAIKDCNCETCKPIFALIAELREAAK